MIPEVARTEHQGLPHTGGDIYAPRTALTAAAMERAFNAATIKANNIEDIFAQITGQTEIAKDFSGRIDHTSSGRFAEILSGQKLPEGVGVPANADSASIAARVTYSASKPSVAALR